MLDYKIYRKQEKCEIKSMNDEEKDTGRLVRIKLWFFKLLLTFQENRISNEVFLLVLDVLQILTLHYFYINPFYPHISKQHYFEQYFREVYPQFQIFGVEGQHNITASIVTLTIYPIAFILLVIGMKTKFVAIIYLSELIFVLFPFVIFRLGFEIVQLFVYNIGWNIMGLIFGLLTLLIGIAILIQYNKITKLADFFIIILIVTKVNEYVVLGLLGVRLLVIQVFGELIYAKKAKLWFQIGLLTSSIIIFFIPETSINYFMLLCLVSIFTLIQFFNIYQLMLKKQLHLWTNEETQNKFNLSFSLNQISYITAIQYHRSICMLLQCDCQSLSQVKNAQDLHKWAKNFRKEELKIKDDFKSKIQYGRICFQNETVDFSGLLEIFSNPSQNIQEEYEEYRVKGKYENYLRSVYNKEVVKIQGEHRDLKEQVIKFETRFVNTIQNIIRFWSSLIQDDDLRKCSKLIMLISESIEQIRQHYEIVNETFDEIPDFHYIYVLFKKIVLRESGFQISIQKTKEESLIISENEVVVQSSRRTCSLFEKTHEQIVGHSYKNFMPVPYVSQHGKWVKQYIEKYEAKDEKEKRKIVHVNSTLIKVILMKNRIIPRFSEQLQILSILQEIDNKNEFCLLLNSNSLQIIGYEEQLFRILNIDMTQILKQHIKYRTISQFFPNINKQSISKCKDDFSPEVKLNSDFVEEIVKSCRDNIIKEMKSTKQNSKVYTSESEKYNKYSIKFNYQKINLIKSEELNLILLLFRKVDAKELMGSVKTKKNKESIRKTKGQQTHKEQQKMSNTILYVLVLILVLIVLLVIGHNIVFQTLLNYNHKYIYHLSNQLSYLEYYVQTCLYHMSIGIGTNRVDKMKQLWIQGYGQQSYVFNVFQQISEPYFNQKLYDQLIEVRQMQMWNQLQNNLNTHVSHIDLGIMIINVLLSVGILLVVISCILNAMVVISVQNKINEVINKFCLLQSKYVFEHLCSFESQTKFLRFSPESTHNYQILMSIKELAQSSDRILLHKKKRKIAFTDGNNYDNTKINETNSSLKVLMKEEEQQKKIRKISLNNRRNKLDYIIRENGRLFLCPIIGNILFIITMSILYSYINAYLNNFKVCLQAQFRLLYQPILFLQNFQEQYLSIQLYPDSLSLYSYETESIVQQLPSDFDTFKTEFHKMNTENICQYDQSFSICANNSIYQYGYLTIYQHIQEEFRSNSNYTISNHTISIVQLSKQVYNIRKQSYISQAQGHFMNLYEAKHWKYFVTILLLVLGLFIEYKGINILRIRLKKTMNLFVFVPSKLKQKMNKNTLNIQQNTQIF